MTEPYDQEWSRLGRCDNPLCQYRARTLERLTRQRETFDGPATETLIRELRETIATLNDRIRRMNKEHP